MDYSAGMFPSENLTFNQCYVRVLGTELFYFAQLVRDRLRDFSPVPPGILLCRESQAEHDGPNITKKSCWTLYDPRTILDHRQQYKITQDFKRTIQDQTGPLKNFTRSNRTIQDQTIP